MPAAGVPPDVESLLALARDQNGLFLARQARELGVSRRWIARRVRNRLSVVLPDVYWLRTGPPPRPVQLDAALLYAGSDAVLSHWAAAECWGFRDVLRPEVHVTTPLKRQLSAVPGIFIPHRSASMSEVRTREDRPIMSVERTVVDLAVALDGVGDVRALTADVVQRGLTLPSRLVTEIARRPSLPGVAVLGHVLVAVSDGARSALEIELRAHLERAGLPMPLLNRQVRGSSGSTYRVDNIWPDVMLIVEVDGRAWHMSPHEWERDLERTADLTDAGYRVLRFTAAAIRRRTKRMLVIIANQLGSR